MTIILGPSIGSGKIVSLAYILTNSGGEVLDVAKPDMPFDYLHGGEMIVPGLEKALEGVKVGDKKIVIVSPDEGYGEKDPSLSMKIPRSEFPNSTELEIGMQFEATSPDGHAMVFTIENLDPEGVTVNGNHPLAGVTLHFQVEVLKIRDATQEELSHGHPHGPDGAHHH